MNFATPIPAGGGTTYFGLENSLAAPTAVQDIINNSISVTLGGRFNTTAFGLLNLFRPTSIMATFTPQMGLTLQQAEQDTGFTNFDWQQTITSLPSPSPFTQVGNHTPLTAPPSFKDPLQTDTITSSHMDGAGTHTRSTGKPIQRGFHGRWTRMNRTIRSPSLILPRTLCSPRVAA